LQPYSSDFAKKKKQLQKNTGKKNTSSKKAPCHDTVRLQLWWSLLDGLQPGQITGDCNIFCSVFATTDVLRLQKKKTVANQNVVVCKSCRSVIAIAKKLVKSLM
jgi:hypothetical protein